MKHKARFMGERMALRYRNYQHGYYQSTRQEPIIYSYYGTIPYEPWEDRNLIYQGELDDPPLKKGQTIYLHTLSKSVQIKDILRSTDGTYTYLTNYEIEKIEDEETIKTKQESERYLESWKKWKEAEEGRSGEVLPEKKSWWERLWR